MFPNIIIFKKRIVYSKVFSGNFDSDTVNTHTLNPFAAKFIRIVPERWNGGIGLRWQLIGCKGNKISIDFLVAVYHNFDWSLKLHITGTYCTLIIFFHLSYIFYLYLI